MNRKKNHLKNLERKPEKGKLISKFTMLVGHKVTLSGLSLRKRQSRHKSLGLSHNTITKTDSIILPTDFKISYVLRGKVHNVHISSSSLEQTFNQSLQKALSNE